MDLEHRFSVNGDGKKAAKPSLPERHRKADQALAARYPRLTERLADVEAHLALLHLPCPIYVSYNESNVDPSMGMPFSWDSLSFRRYKGNWRLCHAECSSYQADENEEPAWKPLVECSTDVRVEALRLLGKLKIAAAEAKEEYVEKVDEALAEIDKFLSD